jgi:hypothetical protein
MKPGVSTSTTSGTLNVVHGAHEARGLLRGIRVEHAAQVPGLVGDDPDGTALEPREADDHVAGPAGGDLEQLAFVDDPPDHVADVVDAARLGRHDAAGVAGERRPRRQRERVAAGVLGQVGEQIARHLRARGDVGHRRVADAVSLVDARPAEIGGRDVLAHDLLHDAGPREEHRGVVRHDDEVREGRGVGAPAGARPGDDRDLRDGARELDVLVEDPAVAAERREPFLHPGAGGGDEADDRSLGLTREAHDAHDGVRVRLAERAAHERGVLRVGEDGPALDGAGRADHAVPGARPLAHAARVHLGADQVQGARVAERLEAADRGVGRAGVRMEIRKRLAADGDAHEPPMQRTTLCPPKPNEFDRATGGRPFDRSGRGPSGT